jgi:transcriptional regulator with XRE-family HTH domain
MQVVSTWTGRQADALREALRMTKEQFAERLGVSPRTVKYWGKRPDMVPVTRYQDVLDIALDQASDRAKALFAALIEEQSEAELQNGHRPPTYPEKLNADEQDRINRVIREPSRLDEATLANLTQALIGQRHAEDTLGPDLIIEPMRIQRDALEALLRDSRDPYSDPLMQLVANWTTFVGWLHTARHEYGEADAQFAKAEEMADMIGDGVLGSTATSYRGYLALLQGRYRAALRATTSALANPGAHPTQLAYDTLQAAQAYAGLGDTKAASGLLRKASDIVTTAGDPPESIYWYTEPFLRMNIGLTQHSIGQHRDAADSIGSGIAELPADQRHAQWLDEYRQALNDSAARANEHD